jgi:hypothetical protein
MVKSLINTFKTKSGEFILRFYILGLLNGLITATTFSYGWCYLGLTNGIIVATLTFVLLGIVSIRILKK